MAADVIAKFKVDTKEYDGGLAKATKKLNEFTKQNTTLNGIMAQGMTTLTKFAGGFAAAELAMRSFNKIILEGSQVTGDFVRNGVGALNDTIGVLASSIATFDWSPFENGLMGVYRSALQLRTELDNLWNEQVARGTLSSRGQYQMSHARNVLTDPNATAEQRTQAQKELDSAIEDLQAANVTFVKHLQDVIAMEGEFGTVAKNLTSKNVENIYEAVAKNGYEATVNAYKPIYDTLMEMRNNLNDMEEEDVRFRGTAEAMDTGRHKQERENLKQMIADYEALYNEEIAGYKLLDKSDSKYTEISEHINQQYAVMSEIESLQRKSNINAKKMASLNGGGGTGRTGATAATEPITSSITELGDFKDFEKRLRDAFEGAIPSMNTLNQLAKDFKDDIMAATTPEQYENAARGMENVERLIAMQPLALKGGVTIDEAATESSLQEQFDNMRLQMKVDVELNKKSMAEATESVKSDAKDSEKSWNKAASAISSAGNALQNIDSMGFNIAGSIMQAIADVALSFAMALKDTKGGPWAWIAAAAAGAATMTAVIATIRQATSGSYAQGGIVPGMPNGGFDNTYVYASPGEVILNRAQQENLLSQLEPSASIGGNSYVSGEQLITVINNTGRRRGKGELIFG